MKILIVEDNLLLSEEIGRNLVDNHFKVEQAATLAAAEEKCALYQYDLVILDLGLPDGNGLSLINSLREGEIMPAILILTARNSVEEKVKGLNLGADDYLTKPFHTAELNARIHSLLRRRNFDRKETLEMGPLSVNLPAARAQLGDTPLNLTRKEYDLLLYFMQNPDRVLTKQSIAEYLWGDHIDQADSFDFLYNHIKNLRRKITRAGGGNYFPASIGRRPGWR